MKKIVLSLLAAALMSLGLVGATTPAQAAPYPGTVDVQAAPVKKAIKKGKRVKVVVTATGNVVPQGTVKVVCKSAGTKKVKLGAIQANGKFKGPKLTQKGKWKCTATVDGTGVFKDTTKKFKVKVK